MITRAINLVSVLVVGTAIIFTIWTLWTSEDSDTNAYDLIERRVPAEFLQAIRTGHRLGHPEAPVVLLLYSDYHCGFCREFDIALQRVRSRYPDHLAVVVKPFTPLGTGSVAKMFLAAECAADQGVFEGFHSAALRLSGAGSGPMGWRSVADSVGVPGRAAFERCVTGALHAQVIEDAYDEGRHLGVTGTPTFFVNGIPYTGAHGVADLDAIVAAALPRRIGSRRQ